jgi:DHA2 family multidrug resistance protein-like MFS transporter
LALIGTIGAAVYHANMTGPSLAGVPASAVASARQTVAGAATAARNLPEPAAARLLDTAHSAFTSGLNTVGIIGTVMCATMALLIAVFQRPRRTTPAPTLQSAGEVIGQ